VPPGRSIKLANASLIDRMPQGLSRNAIISQTGFTFLESRILASVSSAALPHT